MTAQIPEKLIYHGEQMEMLTEPLIQYFELRGEQPNFHAPMTALWRGYVGTWEILNDRLYLIDLGGTLESGAIASLRTVFPGYADRVFAHWYSGTIRVPQGELIEYVHAGYGSVYERDLLLDVERGIVQSTRVKQNGIANPDLLDWT